MIDLLDSISADDAAATQYSRPLTRARVANDYDEFRRLLLKGDACENDLICDWLVSWNETSTDFLMLLIAAGHPLDVTDNWGWTALHIACRYGKVEHAQILVAAGADTSIRCPLLHGGRSIFNGTTVYGYTDPPSLTAYEFALRYNRYFDPILNPNRIITYFTRMPGEPEDHPELKDLRLCADAITEPPNQEIQQKIRNLREKMAAEE